VGVPNLQQVLVSSARDGYSADFITFRQVLGQLLTNGSHEQLFPRNFLKTTNKLQQVKQRGAI
jgi:hypothetical protein